MRTKAVPRSVVLKVLLRVVSRRDPSAKDGSVRPRVVPTVVFRAQAATGASGLATRSISWPKEVPIVRHARTSAESSTGFATPHDEGQLVQRLPQSSRIGSAPAGTAFGWIGRTRQRLLYAHVRHVADLDDTTAAVAAITARLDRL